MKKALMALALVVSLVSTANAAYRSNSGTYYEYDLSRTLDQSRYERDYSAQRRDERNEWRYNIQRDRDRGQYGGGYLGR